MDKNPESPAAVAPTVIREQLGRVLGSPHLRNSKRCQSLLQYVVDAAIEGRLEKIKERIIGVEVFGRNPGYDTNDDSVVRHAAVEVRKRLAQYYLEPGHERELRIVLSQGSYVPEFRPPPTTDAAEPEEAAARTRRNGGRWSVVALIVAVLALVGLWWRPDKSPLDRFWAPVLSDPAEVVMCVGQPIRTYNFTGPRHTELDGKMVGLGSTPPEQAEVLKSTSLTLGDLSPEGKRYLFLGDSLCLLKVTTLLAGRGKAYGVRGVATTVFQDLRGSSVILIGLNNNRWTVNLVGGLRYYFAEAASARMAELRDRQDGDRPRWVVPMVEDEIMTEDYAIVSRFVDPSTEKTVIGAAGVSHFGTLAAGDFLTNEAYMREAFRDAPPLWHRKNLQVILHTKIVGGTAGPPGIVATHFW